MSLHTLLLISGSLGPSLQGLVICFCLQCRNRRSVDQLSYAQGRLISQGTRMQTIVHCNIVVLRCTNVDPSDFNLVNPVRTQDIVPSPLRCAHTHVLTLCITPIQNFQQAV